MAGANITRICELSDAPAVTIAGRTLSYAQLRGAAGAFAQQLQGVTRVAVWAHSTLETVVAVLAALESGVEAVPLNPKLTAAELEHILSDSRPELVIEPSAVSLDAEGELPAPPQDPEAVALIVYTSGTTGAPKGVLMPRRAITSNLDAIAQVWGWSAADSLVHALPLFHVHGLVLGTLGPLRLGGHLHHLQSFSPGAVGEALAAGDTMMFGVPTMYHRLAEAAEHDPELAGALARARLLVSGSAPLPLRTFARIEALSGQRIVERYGLTETLMNTAVSAYGERRAGEVGLPVPGVEVRVLADDGTPVARDGASIGEVLVRGPNLFRGYLNRPEATAEVVRDGWFWTGDVATLAPDGYLRIVGRKSTDIIKSGGFKVGAGEIEGALLEHPAVSEAAVRGVADDDLGERITAWVVLREGLPAPSVAELTDHVTSLLSPHKRPRAVIFVAELPRNAMGKVVKQKLQP